MNIPWITEQQFYLWLGALRGEPSKRPNTYGSVYHQAQSTFVRKTDKEGPQHCCIAVLADECFAYDVWHATSDDTDEFAQFANMPANLKEILVHMNDELRANFAAIADFIEHYRQEIVDGYDFHAERRLIRKTSDMLRFHEMHAKERGQEQLLDRMEEVVRGVYSGTNQTPSHNLVMAMRVDGDIYDKQAALRKANKEISLAFPDDAVTMVEYEDA